MMKKVNEILSDPRVYQINRLDAHSDHLYFETFNSAKNLEELELKQSLNGEWDFLFAKNPDEREKDFYKLDFTSDRLSKIIVPGHIQIQGYDKMQYINTLYPWDGREYLRPPYISETDNPVASYIKEFEVNENLLGKDIFISFQGVETAFFVWINGEFVGYSEDSFTPSEFEITKFLRSGKNKLAVEVYKRSSASWLEDQDFWRFSGIFREVYLYAIPKIHIKDIFIKTNFINSFKDAQVKVESIFNGKNIVGKTWIEVFSPFNEKVCETEKKEISENLEINFLLENIKLWSAEDPNLYKLYIFVEDENGNIVEVIPQKIGLRDFRLENGIMKLNGKRIVFKGVNRHEFNHRLGRAITKEDMLWDIKFMKQHNINAVRTSHYPNQSYWYKLCDEYGIYLIDETNLESHGSWQKMGACEPSWNVPGNKTEWKNCVVDRAKSMLERDKNHPSILIWSCGNESYAGEDILAMTQYFHERDKSRVVHYEGCFWNRDFEHISDIESRMYAKAKDIEEYLKTDPKKPYISCEYMHAMGNSCGGMMKYTELEEKYEKYQGGFIWDYIDQAVEVEKDGKKVLYYGGDFMERPTDYSFCGNGIVFADRKITPKAQEVKYLYQNIKIFPNDKGCLIKNRTLFEDLSKYKFIYTVEQEDRVLQYGSLDVLCEPGEEIQIVIPWIKGVKGVYSRNVKVFLKENTLWANKEYEIAYGQQIIEEKYEEIEEKVPLKIVEGDGNIGVYAGKTKALFSKDKGLVSLIYDKEELIVERPQPVFWRAATDNDKGYSHPYLSSMWLGASLYQKVKLEDWKLEENDESFEIRYIHQLPVTPNLEVKVIYKVESTGDIKVTLQYNGISGLPELPLIGIRFKLRKEFKNFKYYGNGPMENYIDRKEGAKLGLYSDTAENNVTPYLVPQECGNRTGIVWAEIFNSKKEGIRFEKGDIPFELQVLPYSFLELEQANHNYELGKSYYTYVTIAMKQMGIGGDDSWGAPVLDEFCIPADQNYSYSFYLKNIK